MSDEDEEPPSTPPTPSTPTRGLGRGLGDLLAQHDTDLPFLGAYGAASGDYEEGLPASVGEEQSEQLLAAVKRHLGSKSEIKIESDEQSVRIGDNFSATISEDVGIEIEMRGENLPLVPSDLSAPGLVPVNLAEDRSEAKVKMLHWGIESRRLLDRHCEYLNNL